MHFGQGRMSTGELFSLNIVTVSAPVADKGVDSVGQLIISGGGRSAKLKEIQGAQPAVAGLLVGIVGTGQVSQGIEHRCSTVVGQLLHRASFLFDESFPTSTS